MVFTVHSGQQWTTTTLSFAIKPYRAKCRYIDFHVYSGQQWTTATLSLQLIPMHFAALVNNHHLNTNNGIYTSNDSSYHIYGKNNLEITCTAHIQSLDYHRSTSVQLTARLGEPIHERVMSPNGRSCSLITTKMKYEILILSSLHILVTLLSNNNIMKFNFII
ncbi:uncharacterized protein LOC123305568 [Chrysoperla carnea]|uniref:uncharacterized protein LOC123305568 n=1 Tax=Chrysoperla carnea TaxID=189513 RepID=UPI001D086482|nr:uncharacterized protein LOC123305568 [Chrysoperla carnea]